MTLTACMLGTNVPHLGRICICLHEYLGDCGHWQAHAATYMMTRVCMARAICSHGNNHDNWSHKHSIEAVVSCGITALFCAHGWHDTVSLSDLKQLSACMHEVVKRSVCISADPCSNGQVHHKKPMTLQGHLSMSAAGKFPAHCLHLNLASSHTNGSQKLHNRHRFRHV